MEIDKKFDFKYYVIRSQKLCGFLQMSGFILHSFEPDRNFPKRNVFRFTNSESLRSKIEEYKNIPK